MSEKRRIKVADEKKKEMVGMIKEYFRDERNEDIGDLASGLMLSFIMEKLAPEFYNQGVEDSYQYMTNRLEDMLSIQKY